MAGGVARSGTDICPPRHVAIAVRRLLVLGGLLIAGWLLGCAAQSAHADEVPATPSGVVAKAPVLGPAVDAATERPPVPDVVRAVVEHPPLTEDVAEAQERAPQGAVPPPKISESPRGGGDASVGSGVAVSRPHRPMRAVVSAQTDDRQVSRRTVRHHSAPPQAPELPDDQSVVGGLAGPGVTAGFSSSVGWASAPSRVVSGRLPGSVPPAVRTAADEPSFAPD